MRRAVLATPTEPAMLAKDEASEATPRFASTLSPFACKTEASWRAVGWSKTIVLGSELSIPALRCS